MGSPQPTPQTPGNGLYFLGRREQDALTGGPLMEDPHAYSAARNAYDEWTARNAPFIQPTWVTVTSEVAGWIGTAALAVASLGTSLTAEGVLAFSLREGLVNAGKAAFAGAIIGGIDSRLGGGSFAYGAVNGSRITMGLAGAGSLAALALPAKAVWAAGVGLNVGLTGYGAYDSFSDTEHNRTAQGWFRLGVGAYFGMRQFGYELNFGGGYNPEPDGSYVLGMRRVFRQRYSPTCRDRKSLCRCGKLQRAVYVGRYRH